MNFELLPRMSRKGESPILVVSHSGSHSVIVNSGRGSGVGLSHSCPRAQKQPAALAGLVTATPLTPTSTSVHTPRQASSPISKILIKVCPKGNKKDSKTFSLRNVNPSTVVSVENLKSIIKSQLRGEISQSSKFDVGYLQGNNVVSIRSKEDLLEIWANIKKGANTTLWCDCLQKPSHKRALSGDWSSEDESEDVCKVVKKRKRNEEKEDKVEATIKELKAKNGDSAYTPMQYRVWAEMIIGGVHTSIDYAPTSTMFIRAGGGIRKRTDHASVVGPAGSSPAKVIDSRTKCYKQLLDLKNLLESGVLSENEYSGEKATIMGMLKKLV